MLGRFIQHFLEICWHISSLYLALLLLIVAGAVGIAWVETMPIEDAVYFSFVSGLTVGYSGSLTTFAAEVEDSASALAFRARCGSGDEPAGPPCGL